MILKLIMAALLGGLVGLERQTHGSPAGLRTNILVCIGATLFALCSFNIAAARFDPGRVTAQIVAGIGFLCAGTIMRQGSVIRGLTTAASLWTVAAIGIAVAIGGRMLGAATAAAIMVVFTLNLVPRLERRLAVRRHEKIVAITIRPEPDAIPRMLKILIDSGAEISVLGSDSVDQNRARLIRVRIRVGPSFDVNTVSAQLAASEEVISHTWE
jgi:putative Mg2+ transporter-C (MgtC) family protein